jgi:hypothetical protein
MVVRQIFLPSLMGADIYLFAPFWVPVQPLVIT